jgi:hypothetical protein
MSKALSFGYANCLPRFASLITACIAVNAFAAGDASSLFKELGTAGTSGSRRDEIVVELSKRPFSEVGTQAVQMLCVNVPNAIHYGIAPPVSPWQDPRLPEEQRIQSAATAIWFAVTERAEAGSLAEQLADAAATRPEVERITYLHALFYRHYNEKAKATLERIMRDKTQPPTVGIRAAEILVRNVDVNTYVPNVIESCKRIPDPNSASEQLRNALAELGGKLNAENKKLLLNYGFELLSKIDDGKSGKGYFFASALGNWIGIKSVSPQASAFTPDPMLPKYKGGTGLSESFFQETVDNARAWWRDNCNKY